MAALPIDSSEFAPLGFSQTADWSTMQSLADCLGLQRPHQSDGRINRIARIGLEGIDRMAIPSTILLSYPEPDIALLTLDMPGKGTNVLSQTVLEELSSHLDELQPRTDLVGLIIISGKPGQFIAGADLREFAASLEIRAEQTVVMCQRGQALFRRLSQCPFVTVAAIDGICVGGGAELASWCDRRVMSDSPKTQFGFPEVKLGLYPGWGGTVRAPRIVGLSNAVEMITGGESISARDAWRMGWAADVVPASNLLASAIGVVRDEQKQRMYVADRERWNGPLAVSETELGFLGATGSAYIQQQTKGEYPAPMAALEVMLGAAGTDVDTALVMEAEGMAALFGSPINAALLNIFFLTDRNKKDRGIADSSLSPATVATVGVIGAGIMGAGIAAASARRDLQVQVTDASPEALKRGIQNILKEVSYNRETKSSDVTKAIELAPRVHAVVSETDLARCDVLIEAVVENFKVKTQVLSRVEAHLRDDAILASNTSTIPITTMAKQLKHPERFCGIHFFNPVRSMKLVEVIRGEQTNDQTVVTAVQYAKSIGKTPIVVNDGPGFLVNRVLMPYMNEALALLQEGVWIDQIERAAKKFGMPMGPFTLYDVVGLDTATYAGKVLCEAFPDRFAPSPLLPAMVEAGRLGQKSGAGFFAYNNKKNRAEPDPSLEPIVTPWIKPSKKEWSTQQIQDRLFFPMLLEATRLLEAKIVRDPRDIDLGVIFGIGFPPFRGGLMFWADRVGLPAIMQRLAPLVELGKRYEPSPLLVELARDRRGFYESLSEI